MLVIFVCLFVFCFVFSFKFSLQFAKVFQIWWFRRKILIEKAKYYPNARNGEVVQQPTQHAIDAHGGGSTGCKYRYLSNASSVCDGIFTTHGQYNKLLSFLIYFQISFQYGKNMPPNLNKGFTFTQIYSYQRCCKVRIIPLPPQPEGPRKFATHERPPKGESRSRVKKCLFSRT